MAEEKLLHIEGTVDHVIYYNSMNDYAVIELNSGGENIPVVGNFGNIGEGEHLIAEGEYTTHPRYGTQFQAKYWDRKLPTDSLNIQRWLSTGVIKGIGDSLAQRIVDRFGDETLDIMENDPYRLQEIRGISPKKCAAIESEIMKIFALRRLTKFLKENKIDSIYAMRTYQMFGPEAPEKVQENPYLLCDSGIDLPFQKADKIASKMNISPTSTSRIYYGISYLLQHAADSDGNTCLPFERVVTDAVKLLKITDSQFYDAFKVIESADFLCRYTDNSGKEFLYLKEYFQFETDIAARISRRCLSSPSKNLRREIESEIDHLEKDQSIRYAKLQREAIVMAFSHKIMILTGGPGTGKTTTLSAIISLNQKDNKRVLLVAPTGRAAARLSEVTGCDASTIHRVLEAKPNEFGNKFQFKHNQDNPLDYDVCIIDEMSMVDVPLFSSLLSALKNNCNLILVGDYDQLPSVGAGNLLHDLVHSGKVPCVTLTEVFRQALKSDIIMNAHRIVQGVYPDLKKRDNDCFFFQRFTEEEAETLILDLIHNRLPKRYGIHPIYDIQVITPQRKGNIGVEELNLRLQESLNPIEKGSHIPEVRTPFGSFRIRDKVMQIKNNYDIVWVQDGETGSGIYNGDIGYITDIFPKEGSIQVDFSGKQVTYSQDQLDQLELAYAITVHKSQGSEFHTVILPLLGGFPKLYYRNLLYTAITRAKSMLIMIGTQKVIYRMVDNNHKVQRYTCLEDMLKNQGD